MWYQNIDEGILGHGSLEGKPARHLASSNESRRLARESVSDSAALTSADSCWAQAGAIVQTSNSSTASVARQKALFRVGRG